MLKVSGLPAMQHVDMQGPYAQCPRSAGCWKGACSDTCGLICRAALQKKKTVLQSLQPCSKSLISCKQSDLAADLDFIHGACQAFRGMWVVLNNDATWSALPLFQEEAGMIPCTPCIATLLLSVCLLSTVYVLVTDSELCTIAAVT